MFNIDSKTKIKLNSEINGIKKYALKLSRKKGSNMELMKQVFKHSYVYVHINTSLSFLNPKQAEEKSLELMNDLEDYGISFEYRKTEDTSNRDSIFGSIRLSNTKSNSNIITFILPKDYNNDLLINKLFEIGFTIYAPLDNDNKEISLEKVFLNKFKTEDEKDCSFRYSIFLTDYFSQFIITTKHLNKKEIEEMFEKPLI